MERLLIIRFSAIGDVAMTIPVVYACAVDNPQLHITMLSREALRPLFAHMPPNVTFRGVDLKQERYKGIAGLGRLYNELKAGQYDAVADLHDVLRSKYLRWRFRLSGISTAHIHKGRKSKKQLVSERHKVLRPLKSSFRRYAEVFEQLGLRCSTRFISILPKEAPLSPAVENVTGRKGNDKWIGIAPFAAHQGKIYPLNLLEKTMTLLTADPRVRIFLFGGGEKERARFAEWERQFPRTTSLAGKLKMDSELEVMNRLDVMLSMDSANMHLASLVNTPVVSIWGATHPYAGFMGWNQKEENAIQIELPCRPCSIYGNKPCLRHDYACLAGIAPERIAVQLQRYLE